MRRGKLVRGVGINDVDLPTRYEKGGKMYYDPYYSAWYSMLTRCYDKTLHKKQPTYKDCSVCDDWLYFSNFKAWMEQQDWEGKHLDKDLLVGGNKVYKPTVCLFVHGSVNRSLTIRGLHRGSAPLGCYHDKEYNRYQAQVCNGSGKIQYLGYHKEPITAHRAWQTYKIKVLDNLKDSQPDFLVKIGLQRIIDKIQDDYDNNRETIDFN